MSNNKLKILGLGSIILLDSEPELGKDYRVCVRVSRSGIADIDEKDPTEPITTYKMEYLSTECVEDLGASKKLGFQKGKTQSQKLRFVLMDLAEKLGKDTEEFYKEQMIKLIEFYKNKLE